MQTKYAHADLCRSKVFYPVIAWITPVILAFKTVVYNNTYYTQTL